jgi:pimeloyl-ACP methyl ester carboxylesterase
MRASANGIEIEYDTFGERSGSPLLLIMGLGSQLTLWEPEFCESLADKGCDVIRFDNRDVGLSTKLDSAGVPDIPRLLAAMAVGEKVDVPYLLDDMAADAVGLLDALDVDRAAVVGMSMGGMIAQLLAIGHPERVQSLVSIMSATGDPSEPRSDPAVLARLLAPPPPEREARIEQSVELWRLLSGPGFEFPEERIRARCARDHDRSFYPEGAVRQFAAIVAGGSRTAALGELDLPTLVIHGGADRLVPVGCGRMTADVIPGAEFVEIDGMGHDIPVEIAEDIATMIAALATR